MLERPAQKLQRAIMPALFAGACLGGCTSTTESSLTFFADPAQYEFSSCQFLATQRKRWQGRQQELKLLMDRAERSAGGGVVNLIAYQGDYAAAGEELKLVEKAQRQKNCDLPENWGSNSAIR
jgi:hypothetical protein